jgi:hypothetical protein
MKTENLIVGLRAMDAYAKQECMHDNNLPSAHCSPTNQNERSNFPVWMRSPNLQNTYACTCPLPEHACQIHETNMHVIIPIHSACKVAAQPKLTIHTRPMASAAVA